MFLSLFIAAIFCFSGCDTFKKNEVNILPTSETINQSVVDLVKLYYPNASDIKIRVIIPNKVWEASFNDDGTQAMDFDD
ncbi:MAG: hypothetical protein R2822_31005 [Spirosomataceae bacterium]